MSRYKALLARSVKPAAPRLRLWVRLAALPKQTRGPEIPAIASSGQTIHCTSSVSNLSLLSGPRLPKSLFFFNCHPDGLK